MDDYEAYVGPRVLISKRRHEILEHTVVGCWTCEATVRIADAFDRDLGWGIIENVPLDNGVAVTAWECPSCGAPEKEMRELGHV